VAPAEQVLIVAKGDLVAEGLPVDGDDAPVPVIPKLLKEVLGHGNREGTHGGFLAVAVALGHSWVRSITSALARSKSNSAGGIANSSRSAACRIVAIASGSLLAICLLSRCRSP